MKAIVVRRYGDWRDVMRIEDIDRPAPAPDEVLVEVHGVTVNRTRDTQIAGGNYTDNSVLPIIPGMDPSGIVVDIGEAVTGFAKGDRIVVNSRTPCGTCRFCLAGNDGECGNGRQIGIHRPGGYAEFVAAPVDNCRAIPKDVSFHEATVFMRHCPTSLQLLETKAGLQAGETVLIMGAGGGLGSTGVQIAKLMGAIVIAAAGADERVQLGIDLGADHGINYRTHDLVEQVMKITDGKGADVVYENISDPTTWPKAFACLAYGGRLVTAGAHGGGKVEIDIKQLYLKRLQVLGAAGSSRRNLDSALAFAETGKLTCAIDEILPLSRLHEAFDRVGAGTVTGKLVIDPSRPD
jgi:NADPH:quinone reductase-like Zn-dependent oxidoreductase